MLLPLHAETDGATLLISAVRPGEDGNMIRMYAVAKNDRLRTTEARGRLPGRQLRRHLARHARLQLARDPADPPDVAHLRPRPGRRRRHAGHRVGSRLHQLESRRPGGVSHTPVAGPESVRVEANDSWCTYQGDWAEESGFYSGGFARRTSTFFDTLTVFYSCPSAHDLYIGTSLYSDRGVAGVSLDADAETELDCHLDAEPAVVTRRKVRPAVSAGEHTVTIRLLRGGPFYFDFLEAAVPTDIPDPLPADCERLARPWTTAPTTLTNCRPRASSGCSTSSAIAGPMNEYLGVFWWNQRKRVDAVDPVGLGHVRRSVPARGPGLREHRRPDLRQDRVSERRRRPHRPALRLLHQRDLRRRLGRGGGQRTHHHRPIPAPRLFLHVSGLEGERRGSSGTVDLDRKPPGRRARALGGGPSADAGAQPGRARMAPGLLRPVPLPGQGSHRGRVHGTGQSTRGFRRSLRRWARLSKHRSGSEI